MAREEFNQLCQIANLFNSLCGDRESDLAFGLSQQTVVDELDAETKITLQLSFCEFLEALARVADKTSLIPPFHSKVRHPRFDARVGDS